MQDKIEADLKTALLTGEKAKVETLRGLKAALLNEAIALGARDSGLNDEQIEKVLAKEAKKRTEAAQMYQKGGAEDRASAELAEKAIIDGYLPDQADESQIADVVATKIAELGASSAADMGKVIGAVKAQLGASADGAVVARIVKEKLSQ